MHPGLQAASLAGLASRTGLVPQIADLNLVTLVVSTPKQISITNSTADGIILMGPISTNSSVTMSRPYPKYNNCGDPPSGCEHRRSVGPDGYVSDQDYKGRYTYPFAGRYPTQLIHCPSPDVRHRHQNFLEKDKKTSSRSNAPFIRRISHMDRPPSHLQRVSHWAMIYWRTCPLMTFPAAKVAHTRLALRKRTFPGVGMDIFKVDVAIGEMDTQLETPEPACEVIDVSRTVAVVKLKSSRR